MSTIARPAEPRRARPWLGMLLGVAMGLGNLIGYLVVLLLSRSLGPADFGGYTALSTYGVLLAIPAGAFQVAIARRVSVGVDATTGIALAAGIGLALWALTCLAAPLLQHAFHLRSVWSPVLLGAMLVPMNLTGCFQGLLLGRHRVGALSLLYVVTAAARFVAALVARLWDLNVAQVFAAMLAASIVAAAAGWALCRSDLARLPSHGHRLAAEMALSNSTLAAFTALTTVDVLLARHFLDPHTSGGYSLAATFGRAICWGTQFVALMIVPRMSSENATRTLLRASGLVLAGGLLGLAIVAAAPERLITLAGGSQFRSYSSVAIACTGLGVAWALAQVWLFAEMGSGGTRLGLLTWVVTAAECLAIAVQWHHSPAQIVAVATVGAVVVALAGFVHVWRRHQAMTAPSEESAFALASLDRP